VKKKKLGGVGWQGKGTFLPIWEKKQQKKAKDMGGEKEAEPRPYSPKEKKKEREEEGAFLRK